MRSSMDAWPPYLPMRRIGFDNFWNKRIARRPRVVIRIGHEALTENGDGVLLRREGPSIYPTPSALLEWRPADAMAGALTPLQKLLPFQFSKILANAGVTARGLRQIGDHPGTKRFRSGK